MMHVGKVLANISYTLTTCKASIVSYFALCVNVVTGYTTGKVLPACSREVVILHLFLHITFRYYMLTKVALPCIQKHTTSISIFIFFVCGYYVVYILYVYVGKVLSVQYYTYGQYPGTPVFSLRYART